MGESERRFFTPARVGFLGVPVWHFSVCLLFVCLSLPGWVAGDPPWRTAMSDPHWATHPRRPTLGDPPQATHPGATHLGRLTPLDLFALWQV